MRKLWAARRFLMGEQQAQGLRLAKAEREVAQSARRRGELRCLRASDRVVPVDLHSGHFSGQNVSAPCLIPQAQDISIRREAETQLQHIANHDSLSSLANRARFAVMYLDLDRFKLINDTLGHAAGDQFLTIVTQRIRLPVRPGDRPGPRAQASGQSVAAADDLAPMTDHRRQAVELAATLH